MQHLVTWLFANRSQFRFHLVALPCDDGGSCAEAVAMQRLPLAGEVEILQNEIQQPSVDFDNL